MDSRKAYRNLFDGNGRPAAGGVALYADAMLLHRLEDLPQRLYEGVQNDSEALGNTLRLYNALKANYDFGAWHPFFDGLLPRLREEFLNSEACCVIEEYEYAIDTVFRSAEGSDAGHVTPEFLKNEIRFAWKKGSLPEPITLVVENNEYDEKHRRVIPNGHVLPLPETDYPNGLYYYKLLSAKPAYRLVGKFYVYRY